MFRRENVQRVGLTRARNLRSLHSYAAGLHSIGRRIVRLGYFRHLACRRGRDRRQHQSRQDPREQKGDGQVHLYHGAEEFASW